jgi:hypothetical protein
MRDIIFIYSFVFKIYLISANLTSTTISYGETENITCKNIRNMHIILLSSFVFYFDLLQSSRISLCLKKWIKHHLQQLWKHSTRSISLQISIFLVFIYIFHFMQIIIYILSFIDTTTEFTSFTVETTELTYTSKFISLSKR